MLKVEVLKAVVLNPLCASESQGKFLKKSHMPVPNPTTFSFYLLVMGGCDLGILFLKNFPGDSNKIKIH